MEHAFAHDLAAALRAVDPAACAAYRGQTPHLIAYANQHMAERADIDALIGPCPLSVLYRNHAAHADFMAAQLELRSADALIAALTWVYRTHQLRGVAPRTFPVEMEIWREAVERHLDRAAAASVGAVYQCLGELHSQLLLLAQAPAERPAVAAELRPHFQRYLEALLKPDVRAALGAAEEYIQSPEQIGTWWECVIQPALYTVGHLWAQGEISVGQEHLATAITQRVIAHYYPQILARPRLKGRVVVCASPGELHEIGARILSDLLEMSGWDTYYTGASTPADSIVGLLRQSHAGFLCISTTLPESLPAVAALIAQIRAAGLAPRPRVLVGGQAYLAADGLWRQVGADHFARSVREGIEYIESA